MKVPWAASKFKATSYYSVHPLILLATHQSQHLPLLKLKPSLQTSPRNRSASLSLPRSPTSQRHFPFDTIRFLQMQCYNAKGMHNLNNESTVFNSNSMKEKPLCNNMCVHFMDKKILIKRLWSSVLVLSSHSRTTANLTVWTVWIMRNTSA